ncbi:TPA: hypothetical protein DCQ22_03890 [Candidatus Nomurabacteria bacterium]|nr:hypothetical protein [Candidatus Nomurabacteria bacterium]
MLKKVIEYVDYDDVPRKETFYFNLTKAECVEIEASATGGIEKYVEKIVASDNNKEIMSLFKEIILKAYGEKSPDGKRFIKSQELRDAFAQTEAYSVLFMELAENSGMASAFINGIIPKAATLPAQG